MSHPDNPKYPNYPYPTREMAKKSVLSRRGGDGSGLSGPEIIIGSVAMFFGGIITCEGVAQYLESNNNHLGSEGLGWLAPLALVDLLLGFLKWLI